MQAAIYHTDWVHDDSKEGKPLIGVLFGYSPGALHLRGVHPLMKLLGVSPEGTTVLDSKASRTPTELRLQEFTLPRIDRRRKEHKAVLLTLAHSERMRMLPADPVVRARQMNVLCTVLPYMGKDTAQMLASWDEGCFALCVTGDKNIENIKDLYEAFKRQDISMVHPYLRGVVQGGLGFCIASRLPRDLEEEVREVNASSNRGHEAFMDSKIVPRLAVAGYRFASMQPLWDSDNNQLMVYIRPLTQDADRYCSGWFSLAELEQLFYGQGPVPKQPPEVNKPLRELGERICGKLEKFGVEFAFDPQYYIKNDTPYVSLYLAQALPEAGIITGQYSLGELSTLIAKLADKEEQTQETADIA